MKNKLKLILTVLMAALVLLPAYAQDEKTIKRKVAIGRFSNETQYGKGLFYDKENDPLRKQAMDILSSKLAASGKFILLERDDLDIIVAEAGNAMNKINADYIILGSITEYGRKTEGEQKVFSSSKTQTVEAGVSIRLVDVSTGMIIYSDKAISAALSQLVENIINKCMDKPWKSYFLSIEDGTYIISGGTSQGLSSGDKFTVYKKGKVVRNPQTGIDIELPGTKTGTVTVIQSLGDTPETEISMCSYEGETIEIDQIANYYISDK